MAIPPTAKGLDNPLDPSDVDFYGLDISKVGVDLGEKFPLLLAGETVASFTLALTAEAIAAGLYIRTDAGREVTLSGLSVTFWLSIVEAMQGNAMFNAAGMVLAMELTVVTSGGRTKQKTATVKVVQQ